VDALKQGASQGLLQEPDESQSGILATELPLPAFHDSAVAMGLYLSRHLVAGGSEDLYCQGDSGRSEAGRLPGAAAGTRRVPVWGPGHCITAFSSHLSTARDYAAASRPAAQEHPNLCT